ncbi:unnamed protein product (macronuclear) [Paramecium tetraurelia]|uniref:LPXTG cell wall anchor domain-containing protein n=1 Tax=Paramecium tetraurelia TaxID=5888 RepID=A0D8Y3_PARTE|nr:uncharacterized protein GSPATT00014446001 [Paramecium tetraurelia]CAK79500.1 unnamed protein product [Paramecium tetraurelia]|eukprot:XP_001446897.1 hypothetical protein (macronuclear) [Paramecium tetraurelia strain d4-2]
MDQDYIILILIGLVSIILLGILYFIVRKKQQQIPKTQLNNSTHIEITQMEQKPQKKLLKNDQKIIENKHTQQLI